ncbi:SAM-dependent methyltransferase [Dactylosporangium darangshiense]|uniref:SAM-dependent methyltransferase n=1 Tax=Dactylosporangium darangshiense TaxID=579108 RepID=A0ABP8DV69_9ACTN
MDTLDWLRDADPTVPNAARAYNYAIGEPHNLHADRQFAEDIHQASGRTFLAEAQANRAFVLDTVRTLSHDAGIRQFLDIGCGVPTRTNAHDAAPHADIVYVDIDPVVVGHCRHLWSGHPRIGVIHGDVRQPEQILRHPDVTARLDLTQPIGVLLGAVLDFVADPGDAAGILTQLAAAAAPGSYLALSHSLVTSRNIAQQDRVRRLFRQTATPLYPRTAAQLHTILDGWSRTEPNLNPITHWHPEPLHLDRHAPIGAIAIVARNRPCRSRPPAGPCQGSRPPRPETADPAPASAPLAPVTHCDDDGPAAAQHSRHRKMFCVSMQDVGTSP